MIVDALVPVKAATTAKTRLAPLLSPDERVLLVQAMLQDVVEALHASRLLRRVIVTSPDVRVRALAERLGAVALPEPEGLGLNGGLAFGLRHCQQAGAAAALIVAADLPAIGAGDIAALLLPAFRGPRVRAAPSRDGGTGALLLAPPNAIAPAFGDQSFSRHQQAAQAAGVRFEPRSREGLAADIDAPWDLAQVFEFQGARHTRAFLAVGGISERRGIREALTESRGG
jgi:2-phospho-L-lactate guanylyltransferase